MSDLTKIKKNVEAAIKCIKDNEPNTAQNYLNAVIQHIEYLVKLGAVIKLKS